MLRRDGNIEMNIIQDGGCGLDSCASGYGAGTACFDHDNAVSTKCGEFLNYRRTC